MVLLPLVPLQSELIAYSILALRAKIYKPLAPSSFCKSSGWVRQQHGPAFINCLRRWKATLERFQNTPPSPITLQSNQSSWSVFIHMYIDSKGDHQHETMTTGLETRRE